MLKAHETSGPIDIMAYMIDHLLEVYETRLILFSSSLERGFEIYTTTHHVALEQSIP